MPQIKCDNCNSVRDSSLKFCICELNGRIVIDSLSGEIIETSKDACKKLEEIIKITTELNNASNSN